MPTCPPRLGCCWDLYKRSCSVDFTNRMFVRIPSRRIVRTGGCRIATQRYRPLALSFSFPLFSRKSLSWGPGSGPANSNPCTSSQPARSRNAFWASVSTPSASKTPQWGRSLLSVGSYPVSAIRGTSSTPLPHPESLAVFPRFSGCVNPCRRTLPAPRRGDSQGLGPPGTLL